MTLKIQTSHEIKKIEQTSKVDIIKCLAIIKVIHPNWATDEELATNIWHFEFRHDDPTIVKKAIHKVSTESKYIPKIYDVRNEVDLMTRELEFQRNLSDEQREERKMNQWFSSLSRDELDKLDDLTFRFLEGEDISVIRDSPYLTERAKLLEEIRAWNIPEQIRWEKWKQEQNNAESRKEI